MSSDTSNETCGMFSHIFIGYNFGAFGATRILGVYGALSISINPVIFGIYVKYVTKTTIQILFL